MLELKTIGERLGISHRALRYVMDGGLVPGLESANKGRGTKRVLTETQSVLVAVAARLQQYGLHRDAIKQAAPQLKQQVAAKRKTVVIAADKHVNVHVFCQDIYDKLLKFRENGKRQ